MPRGGADVVPEDASNVLLVSSAMNPAEERACTELLTRDTDPSDLAVLAISYRDAAEDVLADIREALDAEPGRVTVVSIGEEQRFGVEPPAGAPGSHPEAPSVEVVEAPSDLTALGIIVSDYLIEWERDRWANAPSDLAICYDSLTALLQHVEERRAYRFLHIITRRITEADATAHYHFHADAHDDRTVALFESMFDEAVEVSTDGDWTVRHR